MSKANTATATATAKANKRLQTLTTSNYTYTAGLHTFAKIRDLPMLDADILATEAAKMARAADNVANIAIGELFVAVWSMMGKNFDGKKAWVIVKDKLEIGKGERHKAQAYWSFFVRSAEAGQPEFIMTKGIRKLQAAFPTQRPAKEEDAVSDVINDASDAIDAIEDNDNASDVESFQALANAQALEIAALQERNDLLEAQNVELRAQLKAALAKLPKTVKAEHGFSERLLANREEIKEAQTV